MTEKPAADSDRRQFDPRVYFIPREQRVPGTPHTVFRTHDGDAYVRDGRSQVIRRAQPKVRGEAARRAERQARRTAREARG